MEVRMKVRVFFGDSLKYSKKTIARLLNEESIHFELF